MATISNEIDIQPESGNSRLNEIVAIALIASGLLLFLCLFSYNPNDPSWNAAGESAVRNWVGAVGANVAAALFQGIGLAAYPLPCLFFSAAWRCFRSRRINAPVSRISGLVMLVLSSAALLSLANIRPFFDSSINAGGGAGAIIARSLVAGLNTIGATILLAAIAATGILLATNFSFAAFYEKLALAIGDRVDALRLIPETFRAWRQTRRDRGQQRREMRRLAKASAASGAEIPDAVGTQIVGDERRAATIGSGDGAEIEGAFATFSAETTGQKTMSAAA